MDSQQPSNKPQVCKSFHCSNGHIIIVVLLCTLFIVTMSYFFAQKVTNDFRQTLISFEYEKAGGEKNYKVFQEIQKDEMNSFLEQMHTKDPIYMQNIKAKIDPNFKRPLSLTQDELMVLHNEIPLTGGLNAPFTLIEFSDFECEYCKTFHNDSKIISLIGSYSGKLNYAYKSMPHSSHEKANLLARYARCVYENSTTQNYFSFIDSLFEADSLEDTEALVEGYAKQHKLNLDTLKICLNEPSTEEILKRDFGHGVYLGITTTPSLVMIDNETGDYQIVKEQISKEELTQQIDTFISRQK